MKWYEGIWYSALHDAAEFEPERNKYWLAVLYLFGDLRWRIQARLCRRFGHKFELDQNFSTDRGVEVMTCKRCGLSNHTVLY